MICLLYTSLVTTPGAIDELVSAETLLFKDYGIDGAYGAEWKPIVPHMDALSELTGLHRHVVDFLFLALASERLRENYRAAGLTDELFWDTIADLKFKLIECHDVYGIWGTFVASWYPWFYTCLLYTSTCFYSKNKFILDICVLLYV